MTIRARLLLTLLPIFLGALLLVVVFTMVSAREMLTQRTLDHLHSIASAQHNRIQHIIDQNLERLRLVTSRTQLRLSLHAFTENGSVHHRSKMTRILKDARRSIPDFRLISIYDPRGRVVASTDPTRLDNRNEEDEACFLQGQDSNHADTLFLDDDSAPMLRLCGPLLLDGEVIGVLAIESTAETILDAIRDTSGLGATGEILLLRRASPEHALFLMPTRFDTRAALQRRTPIDDGDPASKQALEGQESAFEQVRDYRGIEVMAATRHLEKTAWGLVVKIDREEALESVDRLSSRLLLMVVLILLLVTAATALFARSFTAPITALTAGVRRIREGGPDVRVEIQRQDEIGELASQFNAMTSRQTTTEKRLKQTILKMEREIQERRRAERALEGAHQRFEAVMNGIDALVYVADMEGHEILFLNKYGIELWGEPAGRTCWKVLQENQNGPCTFCNNHRLVDDSGTPTGVQVREFRNTGNGRWYHCHDQAIRWPDGRLVRLEVATDITELKQMEENLREAIGQADAANRAKSVFLATMSHEIRTPLNVVVGMGDLLLEETLTTRQRQQVEKIQSAGTTLLDVINNILDLSRIEAGHLVLEQTPLNLHTLIHESVTVMDVAAGMKGLPLTHTLSPDLPQRVLGDSGRLRQILINLLGNAVKFTESGTIHLHASMVDNTITITVKDTGIGIDPAQKEAIFDTFSQADSSITRRYGGSGLGLAICRRLVHEMKGKLTVDSTMGRGSSFTVTLPLQQISHEERGVMENREEHASESEQPTTNMHILLVEDSEDNQLLIKAYLKHSGATLVTATDGEQALERCRNDSFDVVLMDLQMPVMDGLSATRAIRTREREEGRPRLPILALTAHALTEDRQKALEAGCDAYLTKPIRKQTLLDALAAVRSDT
ncbi:MAG: response regulator [Magnetococcales bacterium]|nr:response regulator [Magnetococcales bacterium]